MHRAAVVSVLLVTLSTTLVHATERESITISYVLAPPRPLPEGLKAVAVIDSGVQTTGTQQDERERKWSSMAADMIEAMLQNSGAHLGSGLSVAKRRDTRHILEEQDLRLAGLVEGDAAAQAGKLLAVQGLITSQITINMDIEKGTKSTIDWTSVLGGVTQGLMNGRRTQAPAPPPAYVVQPAPRMVQPPGVRQRAVPVDPRATRQPRYRVYRSPSGARLYGPAAPRAYVVQPAPPGAVVAAPPPQAAPQAMPSFGTREVEEISRHLTVQCSFSLIDAVTGKAIVQYSPRPYQKTDKQSPDFLFGGLQDQKELDPVDHFIGELVERATQEFVSQLVPTQVEYTYTVVGKRSASEAGVRALRADDYETAAAHFRKELEKRSDEHRAMFGLGIALELSGDHRGALEWYKRAASAEDVDDEELAVYTAARKRLADHIGRIMPPPGTQAPEPRRLDSLE